jgi:uncharacterized protein (DUF1778 family)
MALVKSKRIEARVSPEEDFVIRAAAERRSETLSEFLVESALVRAQTEMADRTLVTLEPDAWSDFAAALDEPPVVNEKLARAAERARTFAA